MCANGTEDPPTAPRARPDAKALPLDDQGGDTTWRPGFDVRFERRGDVLIVHLFGELDIYTVPALRRQLTRHDRPETSLVVDLSGVELIDSCGLGLLVSLRNRATVSERKIALVLVDPRLKDILHITGLGDAFVQSPTVELALEAVAGPSADHAGTEA